MFELAAFGQLVKDFGVPAIVLIIWFFSYKSHERTIADYRKDTDQMLLQYREDMLEQRKMYENNVRLCEKFTDLAGNQQDIIVMNTRAMQKLADKISTNQFCPMVRLKKEAEGVQGT